MTTQTTIQQQLPPGYVTAIGELFTDYFTGAPDQQTGAQTAFVQDSPFYADPNQMFGGSFDPTTGQFTGITGANVPASDFFVAGQDPLQIQAQNIATGQQAAPTTGLGQYQDYVTQANQMNTLAQGIATGPVAGTQALADAAGTVADADLAATAGQNAAAPFLAQAQQFAGPQGFQQFMSPYQQQVIDATLAQYDQDAAEAAAQFGASAGSAYGGGRFGVAEGQLAADTANQRALLQANLLNQGFMQSQGLANQAVQNQINMGQTALGNALQNVGLFGQAAGMQGALAGQQQGLQAAQLANLTGIGNQALNIGGFGQTGIGNLLNTFTTMGQQNQLYKQAIQDQLGALASGIQLAPTQTMGNLGQFLSAAYGTPSSTTYQQSPAPSTLQTLLGGGIGLAGIIGALNK
tara:strand:- start:1055 stop:2275 length:1221 start_codon:yes stop_codon:yes gene_type:complete